MQHWLMYLWNFYPPFFGSGIRITYVAPDFSAVEVKLRLRWWNRNYIGTLFGGSLYMMCDPFHMVILIKLLGSKYIVRDKGAEIRFLKKGENSAHVRFEVGSKEIAEIWHSDDEVQERKFLAHVRNDEGEVIAEVRKTLHIRRR
jgi:acyl-coenzyme A thioesterase PaaI-like protein